MTESDPNYYNPGQKISLPKIITEYRYFKFWIVMFILNSSIMTFLFIYGVDFFDLIFFFV